MPVTVEELGKRLTQQLRYEEFGEDGLKQQMDEEKHFRQMEDEKLAELERMEQERLGIQAENMAMLEEEKEEELALLAKEQAELEAKLAEMQGIQAEQAEVSITSEDSKFAKPNIPPPPRKDELPLKTSGGLYDDMDDEPV